MPDVTSSPRLNRAPPAPDPLGEQIRTALELAGGFVRDRRTRAGVVARRVLGTPLPGDDDLADHLIRERRRRSRLDGSLNGSLVETARAAWELIDLGAPADHAGVVRMTGYLLGQQDAPGRWGEADGRGAGFFSPGPVDQPITPLALTTGVRLTDETDARFAVSCIALRSALRAGLDERARIRAHVAGLLALDLQPPALEAVVIGTLGLAAPDSRQEAVGRAEAFIARQTAAGTWAEMPLFHALETLFTIPSTAGLDAMRRTVPALLELQRPSGAFGEEDDEDQTLIAIRALVATRRRR